LLRPPELAVTVTTYEPGVSLMFTAQVHVINPLPLAAAVDEPEPKLENTVMVHCAPATVCAVSEAFAPRLTGDVMATICKYSCPGAVGVGGEVVGEVVGLGTGVGEGVEEVTGEGGVGDAGVVVGGGDGVGTDTGGVGVDDAGGGVGMGTVTDEGGGGGGTDEVTGVVVDNDGGTDDVTVVVVGNGDVMVVEIDGCVPVAGPEVAVDDDGVKTEMAGIDDETVRVEAGKDAEGAGDGVDVVMFVRLVGLDTAWAQPAVPTARTRAAVTIPRIFFIVSAVFPR
jgi:hypothetical protein